MSVARHAVTMSSHSRWSTPAADVLSVAPGFRLADVDTRATPGYDADKEQGKADLDAGVAPLADLQERLFAQSVAGTATGSVLLVLQAMDTAGKGGIVKHVVGAVDPQGVDLASFKKPTAEELSHDFLWRIRKRLPDAGRLGVFDRSHYEDVLIARVRELAAADEIERRYGAIVAFEAEAAELGIRVVKVMLHISKEEQRARLAERLERPDKHWKYNPSDVDERARWDDYMDAYQVALERTSTPLSPWHVVPADRKWYARLAVQQLLIDALADIDPQWPAADYDVASEKQRLAAS